MRILALPVVISIIPDIYEPIAAPPDKEGAKIPPAAPLLNEAIGPINRKAATLASTDLSLIPGSSTLFQNQVHSHQQNKPVLR